MSNVEDRYFDGSYLTKNPDWDCQDSPWKAGLVQTVLSDFKIRPTSVCDVGCGAGDVLVNLRYHLPAASFFGFDISPQAAGFWEEPDKQGINLQVGDFLEINKKTYDLILMLDVFEHLRDPITFLKRVRSVASYFVFHIPLDLSASSVIRGRVLLDVRSKVGHIHYYTKDLAIATLEDCGFEILHWRYSGASLNAPHRTFKTRLATLPRLVLYSIHKDFGVRVLGGETLFVLARSAI